MAGRQFRLSRRARADLDAISDYLREQNRNAARKVMLALLESFRFLADNPGSGTARDDLHPNVRVFSPARPARNYVVFFYPRSDGIEISDVVHAAQDWEGMFARDER